MLLNTTVIIEVLSPAMEAFDRGEKWERDQTWLPELTDYLLVSQTKPRIDHFHRRAGGELLHSLVNNLEESLCLDSTGCVLQLTDVYDRIVFPVEEPEDLIEE